MSFPENSNSVILYAITNRKILPSRDLKSFITKAVNAGIDMIQIRESDLADRELYEIAKSAVEIAADSKTRILVNDRLDVALAAGADGVHLKSRRVPADVVRKSAPDNFIIGVSTHNSTEVKRAEMEGADFVVFGPVFFTPSKARYGQPVGINALAKACRDFSIPTFALGGLSENNYHQLFLIPICGLAAISMFQNAENLRELARGIRLRAVKDGFRMRSEQSRENGGSGNVINT